MNQSTKLRLSYADCEHIRDWYQFVELQRRTDVDEKLFKRITQLVGIWQKNNNSEGIMFLRRPEAELVGRWFLMVPKIVRGKPDDDSYKIIVGYLSQS